MNHDTGKSCKLDEKAMSEMQTLLAECLDMERGSLERADGKGASGTCGLHSCQAAAGSRTGKGGNGSCRSRKRDAALHEADIAKMEHEKIQVGNMEKQRRSAELDSEIADKEEHARKVDRENTDSIKSGIANLSAKAKYAAIEQENETESRERAYQRIFSRCRRERGGKTDKGTDRGETDGRTGT